MGMADKRKRRKNRIRRRTYFLMWRMLVLVMIIVIGIAFLGQMTVSRAAGENAGELYETGMEPVQKPSTQEDVTGYTPLEKEIAAYANQKGYLLKDYTEDLIRLYEKNEEARQFVLEYPLKKDQNYEIDLSEYRDTETIPLFMQWDERWGYSRYAGNVFGLTGCGPTCLSMIAVYLTGDDSMNPKWMAQFATDHGFYENGNGSTWTLMSEGAALLGLGVKELPLNEERIVDNLLVHNPIVCIMGPGDFTDSGHFIILTGYENGAFSIHDPNSRKNSEKTWSFEQLRYQIRNLWVFWN